MGHNVANVAAMEVPSALFGRNRLRAGDRIRLECSLDSHAGGSRVEWSAEFTLR